MRPGISLIEKFSIVCLLCTALYLIYLSFANVIDILSGKSGEPDNFIINFTLLLIGLCALWGGINLTRRTIVREQLIDTGFEKEIYTRLEPVLEEIAGTQVVINSIEERLNTMNLNIERLGKRSVELKIPGSDPAFGIDISQQISRFLRLVILINFSLILLIFLLNVWGSYAILAFIGLYSVWWLEITYDFHLLQRSSIWAWLFIPILVIPFTTIMGDIFYGNNIVIGCMGIGLVIYVSAYYTWCKYTIEGVLLFDLDNNINTSQLRHTAGKVLMAFPVIFILVLVLQIISVNVYNLAWLPEFSLDQLVLMCILSIFFFILSIKLRHKKKEKRAETI
ncbi:MAG: hypothetical protein K8R25_12275 [Methanosarcinales archaeon]|nr:hypothetical protein [Methanosarcinales archaeon]